MLESATVLVLGDPGPVRHSLLFRKEIDVAWAAGIEEAMAVVQEGTVAVALVGPGLAWSKAFITDPEVVGEVPAVALMDSRMAMDDPYILSAATASMPVAQVESILAEIGRHTKVAFAKSPRAKLHAPVEVAIGDEKLSLETMNISATGVAIRGVPKHRKGTRAELRLEICGKQLDLSARVVRCFVKNGAPMAGFNFLDIGELQRSLIAAAVEEARLKRPPPQTVFEELFSGELASQDLSEDNGGRDVATPVVAGGESDDPSVPDLLELLEGAEASMPAQSWMHRVAADLTEVEEQAVRGEVVPSWAKQSVHLRVELERALDEGGSDRISTSLLDEAYRLLTCLETETVGAGTRFLAQVARIRAAILRALLTGRRRHQLLARMDTDPMFSLSFITSSPSRM